MPETPFKKRQMTRRKSGIELAHREAMQRRASSHSLLSMDTTEDDRVDLLELKRRVEDDLHRDEQKLMYLKQNIDRATTLESNMVRTLELFDQRLASLEAVIHPIHQETLKLVGAQENLEKVGDQLEVAIKQQGVSQRTAKLIRGGTSGQSLDEYIGAMMQVREALDYFTENAPGNPEMQALYDLHATAMATLQGRTKMLLVEDVVMPSLDEMLHMPAETILDPTQLFKEEGEGGSDLIKLTGLLLESDNFHDLAKMFSTARGMAITEMIDGINVASRSMSDNMGRGGKAARRGISLRRRSQTNLAPGSLTPARTSHHMRQPSGHKRTPSEQPKNVEFGIEPVPEGQDPTKVTYEKGSHPFLRNFSVTVAALMREHTLASTLVAGKPAIIAQLLRTLYLNKMDAAIAQGELLVGNMSRRSIRGPASLSLLDILETFAVVRRSELSVILNISTEQVGTRFHQLSVSMAKLARQSLFEFQDYIAGDDLKKLPPDGTVHELTSNTLGFITAIQAYDEVVGYLLGCEGGNFASDDNGLCLDMVEDRVGRLVRWIIEVLNVLCDNISRKARQFEQQALRCIFLINNYDYILQYILASPYVDVFREQDPQIDSRYLSLLETQMTEYRKHTWDFLVAPTEVDPAVDTSNMSKKDRESVKDRYSKINDGYEAVVEVQTRYTVPSTEVRERLINDIIDFVSPRYKLFDDAYRNSGFTQKNPHKYLKYTVRDVEEGIRRLFSAT